MGEPLEDETEYQKGYAAYEEGLPFFRFEEETFSTSYGLLNFFERV